MAIAHKSPAPPIPRDQNFWQLAGIQIVSLGMAGIMLGAQLTQTFGAATALTSIAVGNLILWLAGLAIIAMSADTRSHSIETVKEYLGKWGGIAGAIILLLAFVLWFALQLEISTHLLDSALLAHGFTLYNLKIRMGSALGILIALIAMGGIQWIKHICMISLPLLMAYLLYAMFAGEYQSHSMDRWQPALLAVLVTVAYNLGGIVCLPTFFRHAKSKSHAFLALTLIFVFFTVFEIYSIWFVPVDFLLGHTKTGIAATTQFALFLIVEILILICSNLVNIYFASAGLENVVPRRWSAREYLIVGLIGTMVFTFIQDATWTLTLENLFIGYLGCMGIALVASFLIQIVVKTHRVRRFEKIISSLCWAIGSIVVTVVQLRPETSQGQSLAAGTTATAIAILLFIFVEETCWSAAKIFGIKAS